MQLRIFEVLSFGDCFKVYEILAAILHLGNIDIQPGNRAVDVCKVSDREKLEIIANLLGISARECEKALVTHSIKSVSR